MTTNDPTATAKEPRNLQPTMDLSKFITLLDVALGSMTDNNLVRADLQFAVDAEWFDKLLEANRDMTSVYPGPHLELKHGDIAVLIWPHEIPDEGEEIKDAQPNASRSDESPSADGADGDQYSAGTG